MIFKRYESRQEAGKILIEHISNIENVLIEAMINKPEQFFVFAIPNGGVPVAEGFCSELKINYDIMIVRKIKIPYNPEAGFGSITTDGTILMNEPLLQSLNLSKLEIDQSIEITKNEIDERLEFYHKARNLELKYKELIEKKSIFFIDDGLASGFTMLAAINMVKKYNPREMCVAVPTAPFHTVIRVKQEVKDVYCPNIRKTTWFAVADAYKYWYDVPESEVLQILNQSEFYIENKFK